MMHVKKEEVVKRLSKGPEKAEFKDLEKALPARGQRVSWGKLSTRSAVHHPGVPLGGSRVTMMECK